MNINANYAITLNVYDVANALEVNPETVRRWIRSGKLKAEQNSKKEGNVITMKAFKEFAAEYNNKNHKTYAGAHMKQTNDFTNKYTIEFNDRSYMWNEYAPLANRHFVDICLHSLINKHVNRGTEWECGATFINELLDDLHLPRTKRGQVEGWKVRPGMTYEEFERRFDIQVVYRYSDDEENKDQICAISIDIWTDGNVMDELMD